VNLPSVAKTLSITKKKGIDVNLKIMGPTFGKLWIPRSFSINWLFQSSPAPWCSSSSSG
jgi:hypothetical protein